MHWAPYQLRWLNDRARMRACVKSRRIGFSEVVAFEAAGRALGLELIGGRFHRCTPTRQNIVSASAEQAKKLLARVREHVFPMALVFDKRGDDVFIEDNKMSLTLFNGVVLQAFSSNPDSIAGDEGDLVWDEAGRTSRAEDVWAAAKPLADANWGNPVGFRVSVVGTPVGDTNMFHTICRGELKDEFGQHTITIHDAHRDGFPFTKSLEAMRRGMTSDKWKQEYECDFLTASQRYIDEKLYDKCTVGGDTDRPVPEFPRDALRYAGNDVGRVNDLSALCRLTLHNGKLWQEGLVQVERGMPFDAQERWVGRELESLHRMAVDATGMGMQYAERMQRVHGSRVEPVTFTNALKEELATGLKLAMERGILRLRADDTDLRDDVLLLRRQVTSAGNIRFDADRSADKGHADRAWALALAVHASGKATTRTEPLGPHALMPPEQPPASSLPFDPLRRQPHQQPPEHDGWQGNGPFAPTRRRAWE